MYEFKMGDRVRDIKWIKKGTIKNDHTNYMSSIGQYMNSLGHYYSDVQWDNGNREWTLNNYLIKIEKGEENNMIKEFKKSDLKTHMGVVLRHGNKGIVYLNTINKDIIINQHWVYSLNAYTQYLKSNTDKKYDIVKIYQFPAYEIPNSYSFIMGKLIWEENEHTVQFDNDESYHISENELQKMKNIINN